jgi:hypothetical protein
MSRFVKSLFRSSALASTSFQYLLNFIKFLGILNFIKFLGILNFIKFLGKKTGLYVGVVKFQQVTVCFPFGRCIGGTLCVPDK